LVSNNVDRQQNNKLWNKSNNWNRLLRLETNFCENIIHIEKKKNKTIVREHKVPAIAFVLEMKPPSSFWFWDALWKIKQTYDYGNTRIK
jgi:hypothetical protein